MGPPVFQAGNFGSGGRGRDRRLTEVFPHTLHTTHHLQQTVSGGQTAKLCAPIDATEAYTIFDA